jgi:hypothetical protein
MASVVRDDVNNHLPKKLGIKLYEKLLDYVQAIANESMQEIEHSVVENRTMAEEPLTKKKWRQIFLPIIESRGYKKNIKDKTWGKTYIPQQK